MQSNLLLATLLVVIHGAFTQLANVLPAPRSIRWVDQQASAIDANWRFSCNAEGLKILKEAWARTNKIIWSKEIYVTDYAVPADVNLNRSKPIYSVSVTITDPLEPLQLGVDEGYYMMSDYGEIHINSSTVWGTLHALKSLEQLVIVTADGRPFIEGNFIIRDEPKYTHRGLMIDTSRNFHSIESMKRQIDGLSSAKMNVLHWHITDHQSWPIYVDAYPEMVRDAYSPKEVYTHSDVRELVHYGRKRGVRIIPEMDMPGHSAAGWKQIDPSLVICGSSHWQDIALEPVPGQLDVLNDATYTALKNVYDDVSSLFPDNVFHVGLDELQSSCYNTSKKYRDYIEQGNTYSDVVQHWIDKTTPIFHNKPDRRLIMWQEALLSKDLAARNLSKDVILQCWLEGVDSIKNATDAGHDVIVASGDFWYLDCGYTQWVLNNHLVDVQADPSPGKASYNYRGTGGSWCGPYKSWQRIYAFDFERELSKNQLSHVIGGSVQVWSEQIDGHISDGVIWPRAAAAGEVLWSGNKDANGTLRLQDMGPRMLQFRERLVSRGIAASPIAPKYCMRYPKKCEYRQYS